MTAPTYNELAELGFAYLAALEKTSGHMAETKRVRELLAGLTAEEVLRRAKLEPLEYRALLMKYVGHVYEVEGRDNIQYWEGGPFTSDEMQELKQISTSLNYPKGRSV